MSTTRDVSGDIKSRVVVASGLDALCINERLKVKVQAEAEKNEEKKDWLARCLC